MSGNKNIIVVGIIVATAALVLFAWMSRPKINSEKPSAPPPRAEVAPHLAPSYDRQPDNPPPLPQENSVKKSENPLKSGDDPFSKSEVTADKPFEDWLMRFGFDLTAADVMTMLKGNMPAARKQRLLDFFVSESDEGYTFLSSQNGTEFLEQVLTDKSTDPGFAQRIGNILRWFGRNRASEMSDQYESRFLKSTSETEKIGLASAISDTKFLKNVAYDHTQPALVRRVAIENLLLDDKEPQTLKGLLDISDTQPALSATVVTAAIRACTNRDEFQNVLDVLKKEGMYTPLNARIVGEALATSRRSYWARSVDTTGDQFLANVMEAYRSGVETGLRPPPFP